MKKFGKKIISCFWRGNNRNNALEEQHEIIEEQHEIIEEQHEVIQLQHEVIEEKIDQIIKKRNDNLYTLSNEEITDIVTAYKIIPSDVNINISDHMLALLVNNVLDKLLPQHYFIECCIEALITTTNSITNISSIINDYLIALQSENSSIQDNKISKICLEFSNFDFICNTINKFNLNPELNTFNFISNILHNKDIIKRIDDYLNFLKIADEDISSHKFLKIILLNYVLTENLTITDNINRIYELIEIYQYLIDTPFMSKLDYKAISEKFASSNKEGSFRDKANKKVKLHKLNNEILGKPIECNYNQNKITNAIKQYLSIQNNQDIIGEEFNNTQDNQTTALSSDKKLNTVLLDTMDGICLALSQLTGLNLYYLELKKHGKHIEGCDNILNLNNNLNKICKWHTDGGDKSKIKNKKNSELVDDEISSRDMDALISLIVSIQSAKHVINYIKGDNPPSDFQPLSQCKNAFHLVNRYLKDNEEKSDVVLVFSKIVLAKYYNLASLLRKLIQPGMIVDLGVIPLDDNGDSCGGNHSTNVYMTKNKLLKFRDCNKNVGYEFDNFEYLVNHFTKIMEALNSENKNYTKDGKLQVLDCDIRYCITSDENKKEIQKYYDAISKILKENIGDEADEALKALEVNPKIFEHHLDHDVDSDTPGKDENEAIEIKNEAQDIIGLNEDQIIQETEIQITGAN